MRACPIGRADEALPCDLGTTLHATSLCYFPLANRELRYVAVMMIPFACLKPAKRRGTWRSAVFAATLVVCTILASSATNVSGRTALGGSLALDRPYADSVNDFPRLANLYALSSPDYPDTYARYGLVVASANAEATGAVAALKRANPSTKVILYANASSVSLPDFSGMTIYPGWWLTLAGTRLAASVDATATSIQVLDARPLTRYFASNPDVLVGNETMHVFGIDVATNTLHVQRGYLSTPGPHLAGDRVAAHASKWPGTWMVNVSTYCPPDPSTGLTWYEYDAQFEAHALAGGPWDGILWDDGNAALPNVSDGQVDVDGDNVPDGSSSAAGSAWQMGIERLLSDSRGSIGEKLEIVTDGYYPGVTDGQLMEHFPYYAGGWQAGLNTYLQMSGPAMRAPYSIVSADTANASETLNLGLPSYRRVRFDLATALMGDGYFSYDFGPTEHGQTWWFDEYDEGAGSSLVRAIGPTETTLFLVSHTGGRFKVGNVVFVPLDTLSTDASQSDAAEASAGDEQMLVTAVNGDQISVQRAYNGTPAVSHQPGAKVMTQSQILRGEGWLGMPTGPASQRVLDTPSEVLDAEFGSIASSASPWHLVLTTPAEARISKVPQSATDATTTARVDVTRATTGKSWDVALEQQNQPGKSMLHLQAGMDYTLTFRAKASTTFPIGAAIQQSRAPWSTRALEMFTATPTWRQFALTFRAPVTENAIAVQFNLGSEIGSVWLDDVRLQQGDPNVWRRDFTHGVALLNGTNTTQNVVVGPGFQHIAGTQDPAVNNGAVVTSVTIAPHDAVLLART